MENIIQFTNVGKGLHTYTPEMGGHKPAAHLEARLSHYGKHYYIDCPFPLRESRSVTLQRQYRESDFKIPNHHKVGWYEYRVTEKGFQQLKKLYSISMECYLD